MEDTDIASNKQIQMPLGEIIESGNKLESHHKLRNKANIFWQSWRINKFINEHRQTCKRELHKRVQKRWSQHLRHKQHNSHRNTRSYFTRMERPSHPIMAHSIKNEHDQQQHRHSPNCNKSDLTTSRQTSTNRGSTQCLKIKNKTRTNKVLSRRRRIPDKTNMD